MISPPLQHALAIVDLETTGVSPLRDRIIEIGVLLVDKGEITARWQRLIDPEQSVSWHITQLTGIDDAMLRAAPLFSDVADELFELLSGRIFVAHNARFDYGFLKAEFARRHKEFNPDRLCTVRWSRQLYPEVKGHGLDAICQRFDIDNDARHRAIGDAEATWTFLKKSCESFPKDVLHRALVKQLARPSLPPAITEERINAIPNTPGIYRFFGDENQLLYIGKSKRLRDRIMSHFNDSPVSARNQKLHQMIREVSVETCAGEIGALLKENAAIKKENPLFNRKQRRVKQFFALHLVSDNAGYIRCEIKPFAGLGHERLALFRTKAAAKKRLLELSAEHHLCKKLLGLETGKGACFDVQLKRCKGACCGNEPFLTYNLRLQTALLPLQLKSWPFEGPVGIKELNDGLQEIHVIYLWDYLGSAKNSGELSQYAGVQPRFDLDTYRILVRAMRVISPQQIALIDTKK